MIRVGFIGTVSKEWMGGLNYFKNLFFALKSFANKDVESIVFVGKRTNTEIKKMFKKHATIIEDSLFDRHSVKWYFSKIIEKLFNSNFFLERILQKYKCDVISHSSIINFKKIKTINWIPDLQHIHLPDMFSKNEIIERNKSFMNIMKYSDAVVVSSNDTLNDLKNFAPEYYHKINVLHFVSQPIQKYNGLDINELKEKYNINDTFFYMPNQFWKHKNHMTVFRAIDCLKKEGLEVKLICTGHLSDYRNQTYIDEIYNFIEKSNLSENIKILGLVDMDDVYSLIKFSKAVINPSLFEGWSSTVEECKSVGKNMILSDINVHREQYPTATFFDRKSVQSLKNIIKNYKEDETNNKVDLLSIRTKKYADDYVNLTKKVINT